MKNGRVHRGLIGALVMMALAMLAFAFAFTFAIGEGTSYAQTPIAKVAVISEDVVSPLAVTGATVVTTITDESIAIASNITTDDGTLTTTSGLFLIGAIGVLYLSKTGTGQLRRLSRYVRRMPRASRGIGMNTIGYGKLRVIAERVFTAPTAMVQSIYTTTARTLVRPTRFLGSQGGEAHAKLIA